MKFPFIDYDSVTIKPFTQYLEHIRTTKPNTLRAKIAEDALDTGEHPKTFFNDLLQHGCISGMIPDLVYYQDTRKFYDTYYHEIEELREEWTETTGISPIDSIHGDLKNHLAWFGYEETARQIFQEFYQE